MAKEKNILKNCAAVPNLPWEDRPKGFNDVIMAIRQKPDHSS